MGAWPTEAEVIARVETDGGATSPSTAEATALIAAAKADIFSFCRRDFDAHSDAEVEMEGNGTDKYLLPCYPLTEVGKVEIDDEEMSAADLDEVVFYSFGKVILPSTVDAGDKIVITVDYGYAADEIPANAKEACLRLCSRAFRLPKVRERLGMGVTREDIGEYSVQFDKPGEIDADVALLLKDLVKKR